MALSKISNDMFTTISRPNSTPLIINGDMAVAQRSTSATGKTSNGFYSCDRMELSVSGLGTHTIIQESLTSGAAFNAGFAAALTEDQNIKDAISFASATAGLSTTKIGTANSMPSREEIDKIL